MAPEVKVPKGFELDEGEQILGSWRAGVPTSSKSVVAEHEGRLVLTDRRLVFVPANWEKWTRRTILLDGSADRQLGYPLERVRGVQRGEGKLPRLKLKFADQDPVVLLISAGGINVNPRRKKNWAELEEAVARIQAQIR